MSLPDGLRVPIARVEFAPGVKRRVSSCVVSRIPVVVALIIHAAAAGPSVTPPSLATAAPKTPTTSAHAITQVSRHEGPEWERC